MAERLGDILLRKKMLEPAQLEAALQEQVHTGEFLGEIFIRLKFIQEEDLLKVLAEQFNTRYVSLSDIRVSPAVIKLVPRALVEEHKVLPIEIRSGVLLIAMSNPLDIWPLSVFQEKLKLDDVQFVLAKKQSILENIKKYYSQELA